MKVFLTRIFLLLLAVFFANEIAQSQGVGTWNAYSSFRTINDISIDADGHIWCATNGGIFSTDADSILKKYTRINGMYRNNPTAMIYDPGQDGIWFGYDDGMLEFFNLKDDSFTMYDDIYRANRYNPRGINRFVISGNKLYIATDFGVVVYSTSNRYVLETYFNLGSFSTGTAVNDIAISGSKVYCATASGVAIGDGSKGDLIVPSNWSTYGQNEGINGAVLSIGLQGNKVYASTSDKNLEWDGQQWISSTTFTDGPVVNYSSAGDTLLGVSITGVTLITSGSNKQINGINGTPLAAATVYNGDLLVGTSTLGLAVIHDINSGKVDKYIAPTGPYLNLFSGVNIANGVLISGSSPVPGKAVSSYTATGYYIYKDGQWHNYNLETNSVLKQFNFNSAFISTYNDDAYYFGSWGKGIVEQKINSDSITVYNSTSGLEGISGSPSFVVISGLDHDQDGNIWAVSLDAPNTPLYYKAKGSNTWSGIGKDPTIPSTDAYYGLMVDNSGQKWISLQAPQGIGDGILVLDTGDPTTTRDDKSFHLTTDIDQGDLPDPKENDMAQDLKGEVWVGTDRGVVHYIFPDRIINGTSNDRRSEFLRKAGTDSVLLRDLHATCIAVDAANRKWIGSEGDGLWLVSPEGDSVLKHYTTQNSPLISDNILSLAIDGKTGTLYIATDEGLVSYVGVVKNPVAKMKHLFVYPNPYSYNKENGPVVIDGLSGQTTINIVTVDGRVVNRLNVTGGRVEWNGKDFNGNRLPSGVYLVIAKDTQNGERGVGKVAIIK